MKTAFPEKKMLTMADRFQEALGASCVTDEGTHVAALKSFGYLTSRSLLILSYK